MELSTSKVSASLSEIPKPSSKQISDWKIEAIKAAQLPFDRLEYIVNRAIEWAFSQIHKG